MAIRMDFVENVFQVQGADITGLTFADISRDLVVVTTVTPWNEPPRIRHQVTRQLCRFYNVLYVELFPRDRGSASVRRINDNLIVTQVGKYIRGIQRLFFLIPFLERIL